MHSVQTSSCHFLIHKKKHDQLKRKKIITISRKKLSKYETLANMKQHLHKSRIRRSHDSAKATTKNQTKRKQLQISFIPVPDELTFQNNHHKSKT